MSYRLDDPGSAGRNCSRGMRGCTDSAVGRVNAAARVEESRAQPRVRVLTISAKCQNVSRAVSEVRPATSGLVPRVLRDLLACILQVSLAINQAGSMIREGQ